MKEKARFRAGFLFYMKAVLSCYYMEFKFIPMLIQDL